jgi:iron complex transport system substrate-binding protein/vitamin B12 transport system substrate-binding protein
MRHIDYCFTHFAHPLAVVTAALVLFLPAAAASAGDASPWVPLHVTTSQTTSPTPSATPAPEATAPSTAAITVTDDRGRTVTLDHPATHALTLAPHATELVYAAGAGDRLAATVRGSDYPPAARQLASIGDGTQPDPERVAALHPDLVIAWLPANAAPLLPVLQKLNIPIFYSDPHTLAEIPDSIERFGVLFGTEAKAVPAAAKLRDQLRTIAQTYAGRSGLRIFIQAGLNPLFTLNHASIVNDAVQLCGGINVFADAPVTAPEVSVEAVLAARPDAVVAGVEGREGLRATATAWHDMQLPAALAGHVYGVDADTIYRPGPRLIAATDALCQALDRARTQLLQAPHPMLR